MLTLSIQIFAKAAVMSYIVRTRGVREGVVKITKREVTVNNENRACRKHDNVIGCYLAEPAE